MKTRLVAAQAWKILIIRGQACCGTGGKRRRIGFQACFLTFIPRLRWFVLGITALVILSGVVVHRGRHVNHVDRGRHVNHSGLPWESGVYPLNDTPAGATAFADWRGRQLDVVEAWSARATWTDIDDPAWLYKRWKGEPYTMAFGVAMLPEDVPDVSLRACANGSYDSYWRKFGEVISSYGLGSSIIRLGWEFNGDWYIWKADNPITWVDCWRQIVTVARTTAPDLQWDWNVDRGVSSGLANPTLAYPGNAYVNIIGVDSYDWWPPATMAVGWQTELNGKQGLNYWLAFAKGRGKLLSVPEWGNVYNGVSAGRDDPQYVRDMKTFFAANASEIAFECNFQGKFSNYGARGLVPRAAAAYKTEF